MIRAEVITRYDIYRGFPLYMKEKMQALTDVQETFKAEDQKLLADIQEAFRAENCKHQAAIMKKMEERNKNFCQKLNGNSKQHHES